MNEVNGLANYKEQFPSIGAATSSNSGRSSGLVKMKMKTTKIFNFSRKIRNLGF